MLPNRMTYMYPKRRLGEDGKIPRERMVSSALNLQNRQDGTVNQEASYTSAEFNERRARENQTHDTEIISNCFHSLITQLMNAWTWTSHIRERPGYDRTAHSSLVMQFPVPCSWFQAKSNLPPRKPEPLVRSKPMEIEAKSEDKPLFNLSIVLTIIWQRAKSILTLIPQMKVVDSISVDTRGLVATSRHACDRKRANGTHYQLETRLIDWE